MDVNNKKYLKRIIFYLLTWLFLLLVLLALHLLKKSPQWLLQDPIHYYYLCGLTGGLGGITYLLRAVYVNACAKKIWDPDWWPWYLIRPFISVLMGTISCLVIKAGLLIVGAPEGSITNTTGLLFFAFIAGLNVDKFVTKLEDLAQSVWGIEKSRASRD